jgi:hypothetical protein
MKKTSNILAAFVCLLFSTISIVNIHADVFDWTYTGTSFDGSGTVDATSLGSGTYLATNIAGVFDNLNITGLYPNELPLNQYLFPGQTPLISDFPSDGDGGISFITSDSTQWTLSSTLTGYSSFANDSRNDAGVFTLTAVPEPSTYALLGIGVIGMLMALRRKVC